MSLSTTRPYGAWPSPISSALLVAQTLPLISVHADEAAGGLWLERRLKDAGRVVVARRDPGGSGEVQTLTPAALNVRSRVHEYGGGSLLLADGVLYFSNFTDQRLYRQSIGDDSEPEGLTAEGSARRFSDACLDRRRRRLICVCEDHGVEGEPRASVVAVSLESGEVTTLFEGHDFYAAPRIDPEGGRLAWVTWDHPNMPWDHTSLLVADVDDEGALGSPRVIPLPQPCAPQQPRWSPSGELYFIADPRGWWNLYCWRDDRVEAVVEVDAEMAAPPWVMGESSFAFTPSGSVLCTWCEEGHACLARVDAAGTRTMIPIPDHLAALSQLAPLGDDLLCLADSQQRSTAIVRIDLATGQVVEVLREESRVEVDARYLSTPQAISFPSVGGRVAHAFFYPPRNADVSPPEGALPPLIVRAHGGPTAAFSPGFSPSTQFWTSRGVAVLDVNYGGSTGYGRAYRELLKGEWGVVDVEDCIAAAQHLIETRRVDPEQVAIKGGSAGGYTVLAVLTTEQDVFRAGASYYGISELIALAEETHKFESRYIDTLIAPLPEGEAIYRARSPLHRAENLRCPIIFFQGAEDRAVPPNQAEMMVDVLRKKGLRVEYILFEDEQHGFRKAENIQRTYDAERAFYAEVFGWDV